MEKAYYLAYEERYQTAHAQGIRWGGEEPTPIVQELAAELDPAQKLHILEIGCGEGRDAFPLLERGYHLLATDVSPESIAWCKAQKPTFAAHFQQLDCLRENLPQHFDLILAVAVLHMLVLDEDRAAFYRFLTAQLAPSGKALICTMGNGETESCTDPAEAFLTVPRQHGAQTLYEAATSCRRVSWQTFRAELDRAGLHVLRQGQTSVPGDFPELMYAVVELAGEEKEHAGQTN
ncbi:MAG: class I SAM-dependent methyltransferase [Faecalibacterium sp.]